MKFSELTRVFPAHAGMFLAGCAYDGPKDSFSPRTRGCSLDIQLGAALQVVFPAHAGMFLAML